MTKRIAIFGGHGPAAVVGHAIHDAYSNGFPEFEFAGYINDRAGVAEISGFPVLGGFADIPRLVHEGYYFLNTIYKIGGFEDRIRRFEGAGVPEDRLATFVHPKAYVAGNSTLGPGCVIMPNASVSAGTTIGRCCLAMMNATIGHDNTIGDYCMFTANTCLGAWLTLERGVWIGMNATIRGKLRIGAYAAVGIGSVVTKDIPPGELWLGNPAKYHKSVYDTITF